MKNKVLIAGDNLKSLTVLRKILELFTNEFEVIEVITEYNLEKITTVLSENITDIIILSYNSPSDTGIKALETLKSNTLTNTIPVLIVTEFVSSEVQQAITAGADDFIKNPVERIELLVRIKYLIQRSRLYKENIRQSSELKKLSLIANKSQNSVLITTTSGEIEWVNNGFEKLYEYSLEEFKRYYGTYLPEISPEFSRALKKCKKNGKWVVYENFWTTRSGNKKWIQTSLTPIIDNHGELSSFIAVETDITQLKLTQERLLEMNQDLVDLTVNLEQINLKLEEHQKEVSRQKKLADDQKKLADDLLMNIFPYEIAEQLKEKGYAMPKHYRLVSIMFTDFAGFTKLSDQLSIHDLIKELSMYFEKFDSIAQKHYIEKIKTIGDSYMCAGGLPLRNHSNPIDIVLAALEIQKFVKEANKIKLKNNQPKWEIRLGIHTGEVIAGVIGTSKMAYDIWGDAVNTASRMETNGQVNKINISGSTYKYVYPYFDCTYRGKIEARNKGQIDMYFLERLKKEYSADKEGVFPNSLFTTLLSEF